MNKKELKWFRQFIKCASLSLHHKKKRVRKKNRNRIFKMSSDLVTNGYPNGVRKIQKKKDSDNW